jgi:ABC-2 type transport system ATP-binding protein
VAIIDHGKVIAEDSPAGLIAALGVEQILEFRTSADDGDEAGRALDLANLPGVTRSSMNEGAHVLSVRDIAAALPELLSRLETAGLGVLELRTHQPTLEDVFVQLTGRALRDG